jgi:phosphomannomutase
VSLIVSYSGIRGIVGESLTEEVAERYGAAFAALIHGAPIILLARDTRPSGPALLRAMARGLAGAGQLVDLGVVPTPTLQFALGAMGAGAGVCVTASHNPGEWNGFKFFLGPDNTVLDGRDMRELQRLVEPPSLALPPPGGGEAVTDAHDQAIAMHVERVCSIVDAERVRQRRFKVAVDSARGAGTEITGRLLQALGCEVVVVKSGRESEPVVEALGELQEAVRAGGCDLGLAQDLDADRLALVDERGDAPGEEQTLVLAIDHLLRRTGGGPCVIVKNVATTRAIDDLAAAAGARLIETPVGEVHLSRALLAEVRAGRAAFGGEGNGGVIYPPVSPGRDSLVGAALVLESLATGGGPLSARLAALPRHDMVKTRVALAAGAPVAALLDAIAAAYPEATATRPDGLKLSFADGAWLVVRPSNTEPVIRVVAESPVSGWAERTAAAVAARLTRGA